MTLSSTELPPLEFTEHEQSQKTKAVGSKIGWIHTIAEPGAKFDIVIKDALGRIKTAKRGCTSETAEYGELVNLPTMMGEDLEVVVENLTGSKNVKVFLN